jgi:hypothetical protein
VANRIEQSIRALIASPRPEFGSRLEPLLDVVERLGPLWPGEPNGSYKSALAATLASAHKALHALYKPDETAEGRAFRKARERDPAANQNAQSIVIHSLHRPGAPGIDAGPVALREAFP